MAGSSHGKKVRRLKRKIRQQASKHAQDVERYQKEIQELKLRERHHDIIFRDALRHIYHPYGNERCIYYTNWDKEIADGFFSAFHELCGYQRPSRGIDPRVPRGICHSCRDKYMLKPLG